MTTVIPVAHCAICNRDTAIIHSYIEEGQEFIDLDCGHWDTVA